MADELYDAALARSVSHAFERLEARLATASPTLAGHVARWVRALAHDARPERYFLAPSGFPLLLLPWWLEESLRGGHDPDFGDDLVYASVTGYLAVRLVDDLMDRDAPIEPGLTPAVIVLHGEFMGALAPYFGAGHAFWGELRRWSAASAEMAAVDVGLTRIDRVTFERVSARKTVGAKIPLAAVAHHLDRRSELGPWLELVDVLGCWHQMADDVRDWARDLAGGQMTYFLSEAADRAGAGGSIGAWIVGDGLAWAHAELDGWMATLTAMANRIGSPPLAAYLEARRRAATASRPRIGLSRLDRQRGYRLADGSQASLWLPPLRHRRRSDGYARGSTSPWRPGRSWSSAPTDAAPGPWPACGSTAWPAATCPT